MRARSTRSLVSSTVSTTSWRRRASCSAYTRRPGERVVSRSRNSAADHESYRKAAPLDGAGQRSLGDHATNPPRTRTPNPANGAASTSDPLLRRTQAHADHARYAAAHGRWRDRRRWRGRWRRSRRRSGWRRRWRNRRWRRRCRRRCRRRRWWGRRHADVPCVNTRGGKRGPTAASANGSSLNQTIVPVAELQENRRADVGVRSNVVDALALIAERRIKRAVAKVSREEEARVRPCPVQAAANDKRAVRL